MIKTLMISSALIVGVVAVASAETSSMRMGSAMSSHHHMMMKKKRRVSYGVGSGGNARTTATGGNAGGYTSRN